MARRGLRDSEVRFAPDEEEEDEGGAPYDGDEGDDDGGQFAPGGDEGEDDETAPQRGAPEGEEDVEAEVAAMSAAMAAAEAEEPPVEVPEEPAQPADLEDPTYKAALAKYKAALERKRQRNERVEARRRAIRQGKAEALRDLRRRALSERTWWGYLDFGQMIDRCKDLIMPRAQRKLARAAFQYWADAFEEGWEMWSEFLWTVSSFMISVGIPAYLIFFQRGQFFDWFAANHRPDVAIIKPRTRK